jgi:hypothetical protein
MTEFKYTEDGQGIDVYEAKVMTLSPTRHISELRFRNSDKLYAFIDFNSNEGQIRYCENCLSVGGMKNKLGVKIKRKGESAPDDDQWLSCYVCGHTYAIYETFEDSKIKDTIATSDTPFDNESMILTIPKRKRQKRKYQDEDPDIQREIDKHGSDKVRILQ